MAALCVTAAPFYIWMDVLHLGYPLGIAGHVHRLAVILSRLTGVQYLAVGLGAVLLTSALRRWAPRKRLNPTPALVVLFSLWILSQVLLIVLMPLTPELGRYFIVSAPQVAFLIGGAIFALDRWLGSNNLSGARLLASLLCCGVIANSRNVRIVTTSAFSKAVESVPVTGAPIVILVESDSLGEGAVIAARLERDQSRSTYVLRGTKLLSESSWSGAHYAIKYHDRIAVRDTLEANRVEFVLLDQSATDTPTAQLLIAALNDSESKWGVLARIPVALTSRSGDVLVYRRPYPPHDGRLPSTVPLGPERNSQILTCANDVKAASPSQPPDKSPSAGH
jgi:hypothetical protein